MRKLYTVGVQRWILPFFKKYRVLRHDLEALGASVRLNLLMPDGSTYSLPGLDRKKVKVYPDYQEVIHTEPQLPGGDPPLLE